MLGLAWLELLAGPPGSSRWPALLVALLGVRVLGELVPRLVLGSSAVRAFVVSVVLVGGLLCRFRELD